MFILKYNSFLCKIVNIETKLLFQKMSQNHVGAEMGFFSYMQSVVVICFQVVHFLFLLMVVRSVEGLRKVHMIISRHKVGPQEKWGCHLSMESRAMAVRDLLLLHFILIYILFF